MQEIPCSVKFRPPRSTAVMSGGVFLRVKESERRFPKGRRNLGGTADISVPCVAEVSFFIARDEEE